MLWSLTGPRGTVVAPRSLYGGGASDLVIGELSAGQYTLTVNAQSAGHTGSYGFRLMNLGSAAAFTLGTAVSGTLNPGSSANAYKFDATAGDRFFFDFISASSTVYWRLVDPYGREVLFTNFSDLEGQELGVTGTYTLLIEGYVFNGATPVTYSFNIVKQTDVTSALVLGARVDAAITQPGQQQRYTFTLANDTDIYFDSLTYDTQLSWSIVSARGTELAPRAFYASDGSSIATSPVYHLRAGDYTLVVDGTTDHTGAYSFRLSNVATAPLIDPAHTEDPAGLVQGGTGTIVVSAPNHSLATALTVDGQFVLDPNPDIANATGVPHVSIQAVGANAEDYYKITIPRAGTIGVFDIDHSNVDF